MSNIDRYAKFISEQSRIAKLDEAKQLNEEWSAQEVHNDGPAFEGEHNRVRGKIVHTDGHVYRFAVDSHGRLEGPGDLHINYKKLPQTNTKLPVTPYHDAERERNSEIDRLTETARKAAMEIWEKHKNNP